MSKVSFKTRMQHCSDIVLWAWVLKPDNGDSLLYIVQMGYILWLVPEIRISILNLSYYCTVYSTTHSFWIKGLPNDRLRKTHWTKLGPMSARGIATKTAISSMGGCSRTESRNDTKCSNKIWNYYTGRNWLAHLPNVGYQLTAVQNFATSSTSIIFCEIMGRNYQRLAPTCDKVITTTAIKRDAKTIRKALGLRRTGTRMIRSSLDN